MEDFNNVDIYNSYTEVPFPTDKIVDDIFGGFNNSVFYDYLKLFAILFFIIFCIKIFAIFFEK